MALQCKYSPCRPLQTLGAISQSWGGDHILSRWLYNINLVKEVMINLATQPCCAPLSVWSNDKVDLVEKLPIISHIVDSDIWLDG